jgi:hypothetical protein
MVDKAKLRRGRGAVAGASCMVAVAFLAGCSVTEPIEGITSDGQVLQGTTTASMSGGRFTGTSDNLSCSGTYNPAESSRTISMPMKCNDGRTGVIVATRDPDGISGTGIAHLSDGTVARFAFGADIASLTPPPPPGSQPAPSPEPPPISGQQTSGGQSQGGDYMPCLIARAEQIDDGRSEVSTIAGALTTYCRSELQASVEAGCRGMSAEACSRLSDRLNGSVMSFATKAVLAARAKRAGQGAR